AHEARASKNRPMRSIVAARCWKRIGRGGLLGQANLGVDVLKLTQAGQGSSHGMGLLLMTPDGKQELVRPSVGIPQRALQGLGLGQQSIQAYAVDFLGDSDGMGPRLMNAVAILRDRD